MTRLSVAIRVRPLSDREINGGAVSIVSVESGRTLAVTNIKVPEQNAGDSRERVRRFNFDYCFDHTARQQDVFENIKTEITKGLQERYHLCVLTYGQSASGKTHTMIGDENEMGVVPRLCHNIFGYLQECAIGSENSDLKATVSYLEIYNEKVRDLLSVDLLKDTTLKVREHPKNGPYVQGLSERVVYDGSSLVEALNFGNANRTIGCTFANPQSSRSHSLFTISCLNGLKLRFIDLAGSERAGSHTRSRFREGSNINKSLVALRNVISALAEWSKSPKVRKRFVPYRDSILTWLLKDTLGGTSKILLISTVSPSSTCYNETVNTLRFGQRAKQIVVQPLVNEDPKERTIRELRAEIAKLKELLLQQPTQPLSSSSSSTQGPALALTLSSDSDSGLSGTSTCDESDVPEVQNFQKVDELIPIMEVTTNIEPPKIAEEPPTDLAQRKKSLTKVPPLKKLESKMKIEPKAKVDSHRKGGVTPKPRSQIVAAVTQRLYNKVKRKEVATDTLDLCSSTRDLSITSKARLRLQELTHRALSAHRRKNVETQTSLFPVLRIKEASTDCSDLSLYAEQVSNANIGTDALIMSDSSTNCTFLDTLTSEDNGKSLVFTRTCSTSTDNLSKSDDKPSSISFTKYLLPAAATFDSSKLASGCSPIYASSVNINVNHNYNSPSSKPNTDNVSDDSLEENPNVCFPTPDLISNHNSLEPHAHTSSELLNFASDQVLESNLDLMANLSNNICVANCALSEVCSDRVHLNLEMQYAPQICTQDKFDEDYELFYKPPPPKLRPQVSDDTLHDPILPREPLVLKSIMKSESDSDSLDSLNLFEDVPDSLNYHYGKCKKKKVTFNECPLYHKSCNERMMTAMTNFMQEVTTLMGNLTKVANRAEEHYQVQVTLDDINLGSYRSNPSRDFAQNFHVDTSDVGVDTTQVPFNKYEPLVERSCDRLEKTLKRAMGQRKDLHKFPQPFSVGSDWSHFSPLVEDSSLDSQSLTFSDYGSLPRKTTRMSFGSPSSYLRQLTSMRREIVRNSREQLMNEAQMHF